jgi:uncharacterized membrane protein (UPF0127 family)
MSIINQTRNTILAVDAIMADTALKRMKGLLGRKKLEGGQALVLSPSNSIHSFFMSFTIDALFIDKQNKVVAAVTLPPWRLTRIYFSAVLVIELPAGTIISSHTQIEDTIQF